MGYIANTMIYGEACSICGVHLDPLEVVWTVPQEDGSAVSEIRDKMPMNGGGYGSPVICDGCHDS